MVPFVALFCQPPDPHQGVAAAASTGCECGIAHLLRLAHYCQQRICIRLLIAGEQRIGVVPAARRGDVLERVMLSLCRPLPAIWMPQPTFELRQLGLPLRDVQPLVEEVSIHRLVELALASEDPSRNRPESHAELDSLSARRSLSAIR